VRIGTSLNDLIAACGGLIEEPAKILFGGPMMGVAQFSMDMPVLKGTSGALFLSKKEIREDIETPCLRCAKCVDVCPLNLIPTDIARLVKKERYDTIEKYNIGDCIECGACSYECPSRIPLVQWIRIGKSELLKIRKAS